MTRLVFVAALVAALVVGATPARAQPPPGWAELWSPEPAVRAAVAPVLAARADPLSLSTLVAMLQRDPDSRVRVAAAESMGHTALGELVPPLELAARHDVVPEVRAAAAAAHARLLPFTKSVGTATWLAALCPGCGHFYLGRPGQGLAFLGATSALVGAGFALMSGTTVDDDDSAWPRFSEPRGAVGFPILMAGQNLWLYNVFAAYRDARLSRGNLGYRHPVSDETLGALAAAPFRPRVWQRAWFWAGLPALMAGVVGVSVLADGLGDSGDGGRWLGEGGRVRFLGRTYGTAVGTALGELYYAGLFEPVAVGEEALFRGVIQPALTEAWGPTAGWAGASLVFGAVHIFNFTGSGGSMKDALIAVPFITLTGSYLGYVSMKTGAKLETSVALHFWYDFLLGTMSFVSDPDHQPFTVRVSMPW